MKQNTLKNDIHDFPYVYIENISYPGFSHTVLLKLIIVTQNFKQV